MVSMFWQKEGKEGIKNEEMEIEKEGYKEDKRSEGNGNSSFHHLKVSPLFPLFYTSSLCFFTI